MGSMRGRSRRLMAGVAWASVLQACLPAEEAPGPEDPPVPPEGGEPGGGAPGGPGAAAGGGPPAGDPGEGGGGMKPVRTCPANLATQPLVPTGDHVLPCDPLSWESHPPSSGPHYGAAPHFKVYRQPVPWGFLLHALEHGAVVVAHNCSDGCAEELADLEDLHASWPAKESCGQPPIVVTPDPALAVRFAAVAWGHTLEASCFDREKFTAFIQDRAGKSPEPGDCGEVDLESTGGGWCPGG